MSQPWPELPVAAWQDTRDTVHLWTQVVGKVRMALAPPENHWWHVSCYVNATGLTTSLMPYGDGGLEVEFDFDGHQLIVRTTLGETESFPLEPMTVAAFYRRFTAVLADLRIRVPILARPVEVPTAIPFADDNAHHSYDPVAMHRFWLSLVSAQRVFSSFRGEFTGKGSPVHFFWGAFDLAVTRFSGRPAPRHLGGVPNCPDRVMREAYNRELASCGYWPGGADEGAFYAYPYPEPEGYRGYPVRPTEASFDTSLGEFLLPYAAVRTAADPDAYLLEFLRSAFAASVELAHWPDIEPPDAS